MYEVSEKKEGVSYRTVCCLVCTGIFLFSVGIVGGILIGIFVYHGGPNSDKTTVECLVKQDASRTEEVTTSGDGLNATKPMANCKTCPKRNPVMPPSGPQLFAPLTVQEMSLVREYLIGQGLIADKNSSELTIDSNYISSIELSLAKKEDILNYLDNGGAYPGRYARVFVVRGGRQVPDCMVYLVGPIGEDMTHVQVYADGELAFEARMVDSLEYAEYERLLDPVMTVLEPVISESFDGVTYDDILSWFVYNDPAGPFAKEREMRVNAYIDVYEDENSLDMLPLSAVIHCSGNDPSKWYVYNIFYLNQGPFNSTDDLLAAYKNGQLRKFKFPEKYKETVAKYAYLGRDKPQPLRKRADMAPPRTYEPQGARYTVQGHRVSWMGWDFYATSRMMRGPAIFDIKYKGERISYEIAMNEVALLYGGGSMAKSNVGFMDTAYGLGIYNELIHSVDCPEHGTILETTYFDSEDSKGHTSKAICIFEADEQAALWRHRSYDFYGGLRNSYLVVRQNAVIGNYDYIIDFEFRLDGKLYTKVKASGYIITDFWDPSNPARARYVDDSKDARDPFGYRVADFAHGLIHDHMFGFKVDLDVLGTNNSFEVIHFKSGDALDAFKTQDPTVTEVPEGFNFNKTRYLEYETIDVEQGFRVNPEAPKLWTVVNENHRNNWGAKRGYKIKPLQTALQTMVDSHPAMKSYSFTKYTCAITKYKDSEQYLSSLVDVFSFDNPKGDLDLKINGENIRNEDLVNWVTVGMVHVPTAEDYPMTVAIETGFVLSPFNFFDRTEVFDMPQYYMSPEGEEQFQPQHEPCLEG